MKFRRLADTAAGAIVATAILAGGVAFAATEDRSPTERADRVDDNPTGTDPGTPGVSITVPAGGGASSSSSSSTSSTSSTTTPTSTSTSTSTTTPTSTVPAAPATPLAPYDVAGIATVTIVRDGAVLRFATIEPAAGWRSVVERDGVREIEVSFRNGTARVDFNAELEDGEVRTRVVDGRTSASPAAPSTTATPSTPASGTHTFTAAGGQVTVVRRGGTVTLAAATPTTGWSADVRRGGPDKVEVRFENGRRESRIEIEVEDGELSRRVEDR